MQTRTVARALGLAAGAAAVVLGAVAAAQAPVTEPTVDDEVLVVGKRLEDLRVRIRLAEDEVYARFNELNSDDSFDVHCYESPDSGSRIERRRCQSNGWREMDAAFANATARDLQSASVGGATGGAGPGGSATPSIQGGGAGYSNIPQQYRARQLRGEQLMTAEMRRLAREDPELHAAMERLGQAYQAEEQLTGLPSQWTLYREVTAGADGLPFGAEHVYEVRIGSTEWSQTLSTRTFTITGVDGRIRAMRVACDKTDRTLEYQEETDWTIPDSWGACMLYVSAKRGTTFALYEFE